MTCEHCGITGDFVVEHYDETMDRTIIACDDTEFDTCQEWYWKRFPYFFTINGLELVRTR